jgi:hypothetical protein
MVALNWRKASYSASEGGCVEVAGHEGVVLVRDTKDHGGARSTGSAAPGGKPLPLVSGPANLTWTNLAACCNSSDRDVMFI